MKLSEYDGEWLAIRAKIRVEEDGEGYFARCPDIPGVYAQGDTVDAAVRGAWGCIDDYIEISIAHDDDIPDAVLKIPHPGFWSSLTKMLADAAAVFGGSNRFVTDVPLMKPATIANRSMPA